MCKSHDVLIEARSQAHPWYAEYNALAVRWNEHLGELQKQNVDIDKMAAAARATTTVSDVLGLVRAIMNQPDVLRIYQSYISREQADSEAVFSSDEASILHAFRVWFLLRNGALADVFPYIDAATVVLQFLRGKIHGIDGEEATEIIRRSIEMRA